MTDWIRCFATRSRVALIAVFAVAFAYGCEPSPAEKAAKTRSDSIHREQFVAKLREIGRPFMPETASANGEFAAVRVENLWYELPESTRRNALLAASDRWREVLGTEWCQLLVVDEGDASVGGYRGHKVYLEK